MDSRLFETTVLKRVRIAHGSTYHREAISVGLDLNGLGKGEDINGISAFVPYIYSPTNGLGGYHLGVV